MNTWIRDVSDNITDSSDDTEFLVGLSTIIHSMPDITTQMFSIVDNTRIFMVINAAYPLWKAQCTKVGENCLSKKAIEDEMFSHGIAKERTRGRVENRNGMQVQVRGIVLDSRLVPQDLMEAITKSSEFRSKVVSGRFKATKEDQDEASF